ncbi:MAG: hypothetical protein EAZ95_11890 [Bacteroidetes bacterium]|nr:MAG: hypothetical protein EAZ95_11890 [Bacteroidota bacterium]
MLPYIFAFFSLFSDIDNAQHSNFKSITFEGFVLDSQKQPIAGVAVYSPQYEKGEVTNPDGYFKFTLDLPTHISEVVLVATFVGYERQEIRVNSKTPFFNITLSEEKYENQVGTDMSNYEQGVFIGGIQQIGSKPIIVPNFRTPYLQIKH